MHSNRQADPLFFIAVLPDEEVQREVTAFKQECARMFHARHALKTPPHLTLQPPFRWPLSRLSELKDALSDFAVDEMPFLVELEGFNCFRPRVIFVDVRNNEALKALYQDLQTHLNRSVQLKNDRDHGFHPHMTIAHRDLDAALFPDAWTWFSKKAYKRQFKVDRIVLFRHRDHQWQIEAAFDFD